MTRYNARELADLDPELWEYKAPNSRKWHVYDDDGDAVCRRWCVILGSAIMRDGPFSFREITPSSELCATCSKVITQAQEHSA